MVKFTIRRLIYSVPVLVIASVLVFVVVRTTVDPTAAISFNPRVRPEDIARYKRELGLDKSGFEQYISWLSHFVRGDLGKSLITQASVWPTLRTALYNTLVLGLFAVFFSLIIGIGIGVYSAVKPYSAFDYIATGGAFFGISIPTFWFGLLAQLVFGLYLTRHGVTINGEPVFYTAGMFKPGTTGFSPVDRMRHMALPALVLGVQLVAVYSRYVRASMIEVMGSDYLRTARAKGIRERRLIFKHGVRNGLIPLTTQAAIDIGALAGGLIVTEQIFQWPGMGTLFLDSMENGDYAIILPWVVIIVGFVIIFNLIADLLYAVLDPRIRYD